MADNRPIGVFDLGLGGLTVLKELEKVLPNESFVYFGDTGRVPYGSRSNETIISYARQDEKFLLSKGVKYIVAACGTVSAVAASTAKELPVNFMGVVENSVKAAVLATKNNKIGVIGTSATINNGAHKKQILELLPNAQVVTVDCPLFVPLVEEGFLAEDIVVEEVARRYLAPMVEAGEVYVLTPMTGENCSQQAILQSKGFSVVTQNITGFFTSQAEKLVLMKKMVEVDEEITIAKYSVVLSASDN